MVCARHGRRDLYTAVKTSEAVKRLIPALAADLARQLVEGCEPDPSLTDEVRKLQTLYKFEPITAEQFESVLRLVATGASIRCRRTRIKVAGSGISPPILCKYLLANPELRSQFKAARARWRMYREFSALDVDDILDDLARGDRSLQSVMYARGMNLRQYRQLLGIVSRAPAVEQQYFQAKRVQQARIGNQCLEDVSAISTKKETQAICRRMHLARIRMPKKIRETFRRDQTPIEAARKRAGLRLNGKRRNEDQAP